MNPEQENFEQLRRLLAWKRHEQPPPGYFNDFSRQVRARIIEADGEVSAEELLVWEAPWLQRIWAAFQAQPILAGAFGVIVCGLLVSGIAFSENTQATPNVALFPTPETQPAPVEMARSPVLGVPEAAEASSTVGIVTGPSGPSLFQEFKDSQAPKAQLIALPVHN
jgi:hypothetical protein